MHKYKNRKEKITKKKWNKNANFLLANLKRVVVTILMEICL